MSHGANKKTVLYGIIPFEEAFISCWYSTVFIARMIFIYVGTDTEYTHTPRRLNAGVASSGLALRSTCNLYPFWGSLPKSRRYGHTLTGYRYVYAIDIRYLVLLLSQLLE